MERTTGKTMPESPPVSCSDGAAEAASSFSASASRPAVKAGLFLPELLEPRVLLELCGNEAIGPGTSSDDPKIRLRVATRFLAARSPRVALTTLYRHQAPSHTPACAAVSCRARDVVWFRPVEAVNRT